VSATHDVISIFLCTITQGTRSSTSIKTIQPTGCWKYIVNKLDEMAAPLFHALQDGSVDLPINGIEC
jgi:hypothetical protein